jgi:hypothetical protein
METIKALYEKPLLIEPHYLPNIDFFSLLSKSSQVCLDLHTHFVSRTFRNRCQIINAEKRFNLLIPVHLAEGHTPLREVKMDYSQRWQSVHLRGLKTAYGNSPYFIYFFDDLAKIYEKKQTFLADFNIDLIVFLCEKIGIKPQISFTEKYVENEESLAFADFRNLVHPRKPDIFSCKPYQQVFGNEFVKNLSIVDLLFAEGNYSLQKIRQVTTITN